MGALHEGHVALVKEARAASDIVIVSIFVNPEQFNDKGDLERYPRDLTTDAALLAQYEVDYIFAPEDSEIYPEGFSTYVYVEGVSEGLEGASRPGHFRGVATIVTILFNAIRPDLAFFGQMDAQQVAVIKRMTTDLGFETEIVVVPTVREESGLALSSRNRILSPEEREKASVIFAALRDAKIAFKQGERNAAKLIEMVQERISGEPLAAIDYVSIVDPKTLEPVEKVPETETLIAAAVRFGNVRLIDNIVLNRGQ
jgi:pantoate--beta-alanine ligase